MRILNFFAPNFGSPCRTQSSIIFYQLNFHQKQLVELFVQGVLGDLVHQNKILSFDIDSATLITEPSLFSLSLGFSRCPVSWFHLANQNHIKKLAKQRFQTLWEHPTVQCSLVWFSSSQRCYRGPDRQQ